LALPDFRGVPAKKVNKPATLPDRAKQLEPNNWPATLIVSAARVLNSRVLFFAPGRFAAIKQDQAEII